MKAEGIIASRIFVEADQEFFASLSGDFNPMHMDAVEARRTQAGQPVVHGIHGALWALEVLSGSVIKGAIFGIEARFEHFITLRQNVSLHLVKQNDDALRADLKVDDKIATIILVRLRAETVKVLPMDPLVALSAEPRAAAPLVLTFAEMAGFEGAIANSQSDAAYEASFPRLAARIGSSRVASIAALSRLVGMVCPGLYSIFRKFSMDLSDESDTEVALGSPGKIFFKTRRADERLRRVVMDVVGEGMVGSVDCAVRRPPARQPDIETLRLMVKPDSYNGATALIIGGSRGLGEITAKLIAAGGGKVILTYSVGRDDADAVAKEIRTIGASCEVRHFDAKLDVASQLTGMNFQPNQLYYFATPRIFQQKSELFSEPLFVEFLQVYTSAFYKLCLTLARSETPVVAFYPSSIAVSERPADLTEYAMAKAAGEILCADIHRFLPRVTVLVERLPRLFTDQTETIAKESAISGAETMVRIIEQMQSSTA